MAEKKSDIEKLRDSILIEYENRVNRDYHRNDFFKILTNAIEFSDKELRKQIGDDKWELLELYLDYEENKYVLHKLKNLSKAYNLLPLKMKSSFKTLNEEDMLYVIINSGINWDVVRAFIFDGLEENAYDYIEEVPNDEFLKGASFAYKTILDSIIMYDVTISKKTQMADSLFTAFVFMAESGLIPTILTKFGEKSELIELYKTSIAEKEILVKSEENKYNELLEKLNESLEKSN